jgi:flagellar L-ring protein precursor FlgH
MTRIYFGWTGLVVGTLLFAGCGLFETKDPAYDSPPVVRPTEVRNANLPMSEGSLYSQASDGFSYWDDSTARRLGDLVTVQVSVKTSARGNAITDLSRESNIDAGITSFFGQEANLPGLQVPGAKGNDPLNNTSAAHLIQSQSTSTFKGDGDTRRDGTITANVSTLVTHVYPNGNMRIQGTQTTLINNENMVLTVEGIIRPVDLAADNIVTSDRLANSRIEVTGRGVVSDKQRPGIMMRVFDWVWPF